MNSFGPQASRVRPWTDFEFPIVHDANADSGELGDLRWQTDYYRGEQMLLGITLDSEIGVLFNASFNTLLFHTEPMYETKVDIIHDGSLTASAKQVYIKPIYGHYGSLPKRTRMGMLVCDNGGNGPIFVDIGEQTIMVDDDPNAADYYPVGANTASGELISPELGQNSVRIPSTVGGFFEIDNNGGARYDLFVETSGVNQNKFVCDNTGTGTDLEFTFGGANVEGDVTKLIEGSSAIYVDDSDDPGENLWHRNSNAPADVFVRGIYGGNRYLKIKYDSTGAKGSKIYLKSGSPVGYSFVANMTGGQNVNLRTSNERLPYLT